MNKPTKLLKANQLQGEREAELTPRRRDLPSFGLSNAIFRDRPNDPTKLLILKEIVSLSGQAIEKRDLYDFFEPPNIRRIDGLSSFARFVEFDAQKERTLARLRFSVVVVEYGIWPGDSRSGRKYENRRVKTED